MTNRVFIKIVFRNNPFNSKIDIYSLPIISTILNSLDMVDCFTQPSTAKEYLYYERGIDYPDNLRCTYERNGYQFELFEFAYKSNHNYCSSDQNLGDSHCQQNGNYDKSSDNNLSMSSSMLLSDGKSSLLSSGKIYTNKRKRKCSDNVTSVDKESRRQEFENFKKEISYCILQNNESLCQFSCKDNRYCYVNTSRNISVATTSTSGLSQLNDLDNSKISDLCGNLYMFDEDYSTLKTSSSSSLCDHNEYSLRYGNNKKQHTKGYMKVYSSSAKRAYLASLNYRNFLNIGTHTIIYFDIQKFYRRSSSQIFKIPFDVQLNIIKNNLTSSSSLSSSSSSSSSVNANEENEKLENIQNLLCNEILPPSPTETICFDLLTPPNSLVSNCSYSSTSSHQPLDKLTSSDYYDSDVASASIATTDDSLTNVTFTIGSDHTSLHSSDGGQSFESLYNFSADMSFSPTYSINFLDNTTTSSL